MKQISKVLGISICLFLLILVRKYESYLFYDPLLQFFKQNNFIQQNVPKFNIVKLIISLLLRYSLNSLFTILIIQLWFTNKKITKISFYILITGFIFFTTVYTLSLLTNFGLGYMPTFYIRRIIIQPIFLLLLIPAIYYYKYSYVNSHKTD